MIKKICIGLSVLANIGCFCFYLLITYGHKFDDLDRSPASVKRTKLFEAKALELSRGELSKGQVQLLASDIKDSVSGDVPREFYQKIYSKEFGDALKHDLKEISQ